MDNFKSWNVEKGAHFVNCPNFVTIFCRVLKIKIILFTSLAIPRPSPSGIHWGINFTKKLKFLYIKKKKKMKSFSGYLLYISAFLNFPNFVTIFYQVFEDENIFIDIPSNPPPIAVRNSFANQFYQNNWRFCTFSTKKVTSSNRDIRYSILNLAFWRITFNSEKWY